MPFRFSLLLGLMAFVLGACGSNVTPAPPLPTPIPSTPISTHLPPVPTEIPRVTNAIQLVLVPADAGDAEDFKADFEAELNALSEIDIEIVLVESQTEAVRLLCASSEGENVVAAWLDGKTYIAAQQCGIITLQAAVGIGRNRDIGEAGVLLLNTEANETGIAAITEENFCRISYSDFYSWTLPVMLLSAAGIDIATIEDIVEYENNDALLEALKLGDCAAIGLSQTEWEAYLEADESLEELVTVIASPAEFPRQIMVFPFALDLVQINAITDILLRFDSAGGRSELEFEATEAADAETTPEAEISIEGDVLTAFFGEGYFLPVNDGDFEALNGFLESTNLNFAEIGQ